MLKFTIGLVFLFCLIIGGYIKYDDYVFLKYGVLNIKEYPASLKMFDYKTEGASDFHAEYNITIAKRDFAKLLAGRKYIMQRADSTTILPVPFSEPHNFASRYRYHSGTPDTGLAVIFVNADYTKAFIDYWVY